MAAHARRGRLVLEMIPAAPITVGAISGPVPPCRAAELVGTFPGVRQATVDANKAIFGHRMRRGLPDGTLVHAVAHSGELRGGPDVGDVVPACWAIITSDQFIVLPGDVARADRPAPLPITRCSLADVDVRAERSAFGYRITAYLPGGSSYTTVAAANNDVTARWNALADQARREAGTPPPLAAVPAGGTRLAAVVLGDAGFGLPVGLSAWLVLGPYGVQLAARGYVFASIPYGELIGIEVGGPGAQQSGGGFIGGGFGVDGFLAGAAAATALNALTTRTTVTTLIRVHGEQGEITVVHDRLDPDQVDIALAPVRQVLRSRERATAPAGGLAQELAQLAQLHVSGALTAEEFRVAKEHLLGAPLNR
jgi:hypothetical protein